MEWLLFILSTLVIVATGGRLTKACAQLSEVTKIGQAWIGAILLSTITSLPELSSTLAASVIADSPGMAFGNIFGSNLVNITIIAALWLIIAFPKRHTSSGVQTALFSMFLSLVVAFAVMTPSWELPYLQAHPMSLLLLLLFAGFFIKLDSQEEEEIAKTQGAATTSKGIIFLKVFALSILIVGAGTLLSISCDQIAENLNLGKTFAGTLLLGLTTSLPELVVTWSAVAAGFSGMAAGNIFGSCCFNLAILSIADLAYRKGSLFAATTSFHLFQILTSIALTLMALSVYYASSNRRYYKLIAFLVIIFYVIALWIIFKIDIPNA